MKSRILLAGLLSFFILLFNVAQAAETEPNNTPATANVLTLNGSNSGTITAGDVDWFKITTNADGRIRLTLSALNGADFYVKLYNNNGNTELGTVESYGNNPAVLNVDGLATGTYYAQVYPYTSSTGSYTLADSLFTPAQGIDVEPNNFAIQSLTLPLNGNKGGHLDYKYTDNTTDGSDWYKVTTTSDGLLRLTLSALGGGDFYVRLYDKDTTTQLNQAESYNNTPVVMSTDGLAAGTYYIKLFPYSTSFGAYTLADSLFSPTQANDTEPNNYAKQALTLLLNDSVGGHLDYLYNQTRDGSDWYKVTTPADGLLRLTLSSLNGADFYARLYFKDTVSLIGQVESYGNNPAVLNADGLAADTYFVQLVPYSTSFGAYKLADSFFTPSQANDVEPNNYASQALTLPLNTKVGGHLDYNLNQTRDVADWYKITTNADGYLRVTLSSLNGADFYAKLYDSDSTTVRAQVESYANNPAVINLDGLAKGSYYIQLFPYSTSFGAYTLADSLFTYNAVDSESNNAPYLAHTILTNRTSTGHINFYGDNNNDAVDWFKINYTGANNGSMNLTFTLSPHVTGGIGDVYFQVYRDTTAGAIYNAEIYGSINTATTTLSSLQQGYYYIKVYPYSSNFSAYSITDSFTQVNIAAIAVKSTVSSPDSCSGNSVTYNLSKSHAPYTVRLYHNGIIYDSSTTATDTARFSNLPAGNYYATVYGDGATDSAYGKSVVTQFLPPHPTVLTTTGIGVHTAQLNWTTLTCVKSYRVQYKLSSASTWTAVDDPNDATGIYKLSGLSPYTNYTWRVASVDTAQGAAIISAYSDSMRFITLSDTAHITRAGKTQGTTCSSSMLVYNLSNSVAPYTVQLYRYNLVDGSTVQATGTATFANLPSGIYYATATGTGSGGSLGTSSFDTITPPVPSGLDTTKVGTTSAKLNWTAISCVQYFSIQYKVVGAASWTTLATKGNVSSDSLTGLLANTKYVWQIASADSANGYTLFSNYSVVDTFMTMSLLPVTLIQFNATGVNNTVQLTWQTATETNNKYFAVQRSSDGITFSTVGTVSSFGNSTLQHQYSFTDNSPVRGTNYYRLRQVDNNGYFVDSKTVTVSFNGTLLFTLYPNPAASVVHVNLSSSSPAIIVVYDMNGKAIAQKEVSSGISSQTIDVSKLAAGTYTIMLVQDKHQQSLKFVKK